MSSTPNNAQNVSVAKPKVGGAIFVAPLGTELPTDATTALGVAFENVGYISEDGVVNTNSPDTDTIKEWGGASVGKIDNGKDDTWQFTMIEALNLAALKLVYGPDNVSGTLKEGITIKANSNEQADVCMVIDMILKGGALKRVVLPSAGVSEVGEVTYAATSAIGYQTTLLATPDAEGNTHYEYIKSAAAAALVKTTAPADEVETADKKEDTDA
ncbi:MAG: phage tail protein [Oscillospiraceae bacterium]